MKKRSCKEVILRGIPISKGVGIGSPIFFTAHDETVPDRAIPLQDIEQEIARYRKALDLSRKDLENLQEISLTDGPEEIASILGTHLEMIQDPLLTSEMEDRIRDNLRNTESIFHHVIEEYKAKFDVLEDHYFRDRVRDIVDVSRRILGHLRPLSQMKIHEMPSNSVLLTQELVPSETVEANASMVSAFVSAAGGITSHAAIIARAKGIPYVANVDLKEMQKIEVESLIVDGSQGLVILNPTLQTLKKYQEKQQLYNKNYQMLKSSSYLKGETIDGYEIRIFANLENPKEVHDLIQTGASGVGLFRSEYLFLTKKAFPSEEEQFLIYKEMVEALKGAPLVIRVFDVGGDKKADHLEELPDHRFFADIGCEPNPVLGCRAIRFLLRYPEILDAQLRAILRASAYGDIHILIPMVSDLSEIKEVRKRVKKLQKELKDKGIAFGKKVPIGCMIEVPSSAIMCDVIANEVDFLSIGTNDLVQYVLAADRTNRHTADLYFSTHPSILRLIRMVITSANRAAKPVILCGETAADPAMIPLLIGLGIREFSVSARHIPVVKHTIRKWRILEACRFAEEALEYHSASQLKRFLDSHSRL